MPTACANIYHSIVLARKLYMKVHVRYNKIDRDNI